jgi:hypothetical protein
MAINKTFKGNKRIPKDDMMVTTFSMMIGCLLLVVWLELQNVFKDFCRPEFPRFHTSPTNDEDRGGRVLRDDERKRSGENIDMELDFNGYDTKYYSGVSTILTRYR